MLAFNAVCQLRGCTMSYLSLRSKVAASAQVINQLVHVLRCGSVVSRDPWIALYKINTNNDSIQQCLKLNTFSVELPEARVD